MSNDIICTCAHVVAHAAGIEADCAEAPELTILIDFPLIAPNIKYKARLAHWRPMLSPNFAPEHEEQDIAILRLEGKLPPHARPIQYLSSPQQIEGHRFRVFGYPRMLPNGDYAEGTLGGVDTARLVSLVGISNLGSYVEPGFSGAPVWDDHRNEVIGIVAQAEHVPQQRIARAIPTYTIQKYVEMSAGPRHLAALLEIPSALSVAYKKLSSELKDAEEIRPNLIDTQGALDKVFRSLQEFATAIHDLEAWKLVHDVTNRLKFALESTFRYVQAGGHGRAKFLADLQKRKDFINPLQSELRNAEKEMRSLNMLYLRREERLYRVVREIPGLTVSSVDNAQNWDNLIEDYIRKAQFSSSGNYSDLYSHLNELYRIIYFINDAADLEILRYVEKYNNVVIRFEAMMGRVR